MVARKHAIDALRGVLYSIENRARLDAPKEEYRVRLWVNSWVRPRVERAIRDLGGEATPLDDALVPVRRRR